MHRFLTLIDRLASTATANTDCAAVTNSSSRCTASIGSPWSVADEIANTIGSVPTSSVHWLTFDDTSAPRPASAFSRHANMPGDEQLGRFRRERRDQRDEQEVVDRELATGLDERLRERLRAQQDRDDRRREQHADDDPARRASAAIPMRAAGPTRCGSSAGARADAHDVHDEHPTRMTASKSVSVRCTGSVSP